MADDFVSRVPWSLEPSLKEKATDVGVDFDRFIEVWRPNVRTVKWRLSSAYLTR